MRKLNIFIALAVFVFFASCESDKDVKWGNSKLYMPQAILQSGGLNNNFLIKVNLNNLSDTAIVVGLYRSGLEELEAVSVNLSVNSDTLLRSIAIANDPEAPASFEIYRNAKQLPDDYFTLPSKIELNNGQRENSVKMLIKRELLNADAHFNADGRYVLPVYISNPTKYELNEQLSLTMFIFEKNN